MPGVSSSRASFDQYGFDMHTRDIERLWLTIEDVIANPPTFQREETPSATPSFNYTFSVSGTTTVPSTDPAVVTVSQVGAAVSFAFQVPSGPSGTMTVGTVTTVDYPGTAVVTNVGTTDAAVLDFTLPRGPQGPAGPQGQPGVIPTGPEGEEMSIVTVQACVNGETKTLLIYAHIVEP